MTTTQTQTEQLKKAFLHGVTISPLDALRDYGCLRLAARVHDLRDEGLQIETDMVKCPGTGRTYACYSIPTRRNQ